MGSSIVKKLNEAGVVHPPKFVPYNMHYEVITGSVAYGMSGDTSDMDVVGFCIPPKEEVFPHLKGEIIGFGRQKKRFENWQEHHIDFNTRAGIYILTTGARETPSAYGWLYEFFYIFIRCSHPKSRPVTASSMRRIRRSKF